MSINKNRLFEFLEILDENLTEHVVLVATGGTAMTLLDLKPSTKDIDFVVAHNYDLFKKIEKGIPHGYDIDAWPDRQLFSQQLPEDYLESIGILDTFQHLSVYHPLER